MLAAGHGGAPSPWPQRAEEAQSQAAPADPSQSLYYGEVLHPKALPEIHVVVKCFQCVK